MFRATHRDKQAIKIAARVTMAMPPGRKNAVCVDRGGEYEGKMEWYLAQFKEKYPALNAEYVGTLTPHIDVIHLHSPVVSQN